MSVEPRRIPHIMPTLAEGAIADPWSLLRNQTIAVLLNTFLLGIILVSFPTSS